MEKKVRQLLGDIQHKVCTEVRAIDLWKKIYNLANYEDFTELFCQILQGLIQEDYNNPYIKNVIAVMGKFVAEVTSREAQGPGPASPVNLLLREVITQIIGYHSEPNEHCKFNVCSFISTTLQNIDKNVEVNDNVIELIQEAMLENLQDSKPSIRSQAVLALSSIQCPNNLNCPVVKTLVTCLLNQNPSVRREVVKSIGLNPISFPHIYKRTRDTDASVRRAAFSRMADIEPRHLRITQRQYILKSGFLETNPNAKKLFSELLLAKWLTAYNGNYLEFLKGIKLDADENDIQDTEKLSTQIMDFFFKSQPINRLIESLPVNDDKVIPENSLETEAVLYWNIFIKYLRQSEDLEEYLEQVIPELTSFCDYIHRIIDNTFPSKLKQSIEENLNFQHVLCLLFDIAESYDLSEEFGRKALDELIIKCLKGHQWQHKLLNKLIQIGSKLAPKVELFTNDVYNIIFDIWQPFIESFNQTQDFREYEFKLAQLKVKINRLENVLTYAKVSSNDEISLKVEMEIDGYRKKMENLSNEGPPLEMIRTVTDDPAKLCWCLDLLYAVLMVYANNKPLPHSMIICRDELLLPLLLDKRREIMTRVLKCLGVYCIYDQETAKSHHYLGTFKIHIIKYRLRKNYDKRVVMNSVSLTCDLLMMYGVDWLDNNEEINLMPSGLEEDPFIGQKLTFDFFIGVLLKMLKDEDYEMRDLSVTVFGKLMNCGLPINSIAVSRLILKWFKSSGKTWTSKTLQQKLGLILRAYVNSGNDAKKHVVDAIVPVLTVIANASQMSTLSLINMDSAVHFLAIISDSGNSKGLMHLHSELTRILVEEISLRPAENVTIYFAKMLNLLSVTLDQSPLLQDIINTAELILERVSRAETLGKAVTLHLTKFLTKLKSGINRTSMTFTATKTSASRRKIPSIQTKRLNPVIKVISDKDQKNNEVPRKSRIGVKTNISDVRPQRTAKLQSSTREKNTSSSVSDISETRLTPVPTFNKILRVHLTRLPIKISRDSTNFSSDSDTASPPAKYQRLHTQKDEAKSSSDSGGVSPPSKLQCLNTRKGKMPRSELTTNPENFSNEIHLVRLPDNAKALEEIDVPHPEKKSLSNEEASSTSSKNSSSLKSGVVGPVAQKDENELFSSWSEGENEKSLTKIKFSEEDVEENLKEIGASVESIISISHEDVDQNTPTNYSSEMSKMSSFKEEMFQSPQNSSANTILYENITASAVEETNVHHSGNKRLSNEETSSTSSKKSNSLKSEDCGLVAEEVSSSSFSVKEIEKTSRKIISTEVDVEKNDEKTLKEIESPVDSIIVISDEDTPTNYSSGKSNILPCKIEIFVSPQDTSAGTIMGKNKTASGLETSITSSISTTTDETSSSPISFRRSLHHRKGPRGKKKIRRKLRAEFLERQLVSDTDSDE